MSAATSAVQLPIELITAQQSTHGTLAVHQTVIAGWTGRDRDAMEKHIVELEALGVPRPASTPIYYRVASTRLTQRPRIEVSGGDTSGEVEFVLMQQQGRLWVGVGSDHTDRELEKASVTLSKQVCDKPIAAAAWLYDDLAAHWDRLQLRSFIVEQSGERSLYQEGSVTTMRDPLELISGWTGSAAPLAEGCVMFCGTLAARGGIRTSRRFEFELHDPVLGRTLRHGYDIDALPVAG